MKSKGGTNLGYTLVGESHSQFIDLIITGIKKGIEIDFSNINAELLKRQGKMPYNTSRQELVEYDIISGFNNNVTNGEEIKIRFENKEFNKKDYTKLKAIPRPGHADFVSWAKYGNISTGGGRFSGRMTTPLVMFGSICKQIIKNQFPNFMLISHISRFSNIKDTSYYDIRKKLVSNMGSYDKQNLVELKKNLHFELKNKSELFYNNENCRKFENIINDAMDNNTTVGGVVETIICNPPMLIGGDFFNGLESCISRSLFSIPSVKGVNFGYGNGFINSYGHEVKDEIMYCNENEMYTLYNYNGGINGGISNGEDIVINTLLKPISSIGQQQLTYNMETKKLDKIVITGRHDTTIINRVIPIIESMVCIELLDLLGN